MAQALCAVATMLVHAGLVVRPLVRRQGARRALLLPRPHEGC